MAVENNNTKVDQYNITEPHASIALHTKATSSQRFNSGKYILFSLQFDNL